MEPLVLCDTPSMLKLAAVVVVLGAACASVQPAAATAAAPYKVVAHRGYQGAGAFESTLPAVLAAIKQGDAGVEMDLRFTKDHRAVMLHDETLDRTTNCKGAVTKITLANLEKCNAGGKAVVPTLSALTSYVQKKSKTTMLYVHVKEKLSASLAAAVIKDVRVISGSKTRVIFDVEEASYAPALVKAGWTGALGLMVHTAADWVTALDPKSPFSVLIPYDRGTPGHDAIVTPERAAAAIANGDRLVCMPGLPQALEALLAVGCTTMMI